MKSDIQEVCRQLYYIGAAERQLMNLISTASSIRSQPEVCRRTGRINTLIDQIQQELDQWKQALLAPHILTVPEQSKEKVKTDKCRRCQGQVVMPLNPKWEDYLCSRCLMEIAV